MKKLLIILVALLLSGNVMKKILVIIFISFLFITNLYADEIKIKRIECDNVKSEDRYDNYFFIISSDGKTAKKYSIYDGRIWQKPSRFIEADYYVSSDLYKILFRNFMKYDVNFQINRETGTLSSTAHYSIPTACSKMEDGFDPKKYLIDVVNKILSEKKEKNKFLMS